MDVNSPRPARKRNLFPLLFAGVVVSIACAVFGSQVAVPYQQAFRMHAENDALQQHLYRTQMRNQEAIKQSAAIETDPGKIIAAREHGYMYKNERPLHLQSGRQMSDVPGH